MSEADATLAALTALVQGDRWLSADACAVYLGMRPGKEGLPNRRVFLERVACLPGFPAAQDGKWDREAVDAWADAWRARGPAAAPPPAVPTSLYRYFDAAGQLLYVGVSLNAVYRLSQHRQRAHWFPAIATITVEMHESRPLALQAERAAIRAEHPLFNIVGARP